MSLPQFGYSYPSTGTTLPSSQLLMSSPSPVTTPSGGSGTAGAGTPGSGSGASAGGGGGGGSGGCCEGGRILGTNPHTGQPLCSCQYSPGLLTYSRVAAGLSDSVYPTSPYATPGYVPFGTDPSAFYPPLTSTYDLKEAGDTWRGISQPAACYPYDPTGMSTYPYSNAYGAMDINSAARRKNATRENTNTLKAWLYEHRKNPYPTKGEKIMLAIITKMTLTQVSTWFANARRRLKKENKMTWSPRNRSGDTDADNDNDDDDDDEKNKDDDDDDDKDKKDKDKEEGGSCKEEKDCMIGQPQTNDTVVHAKRLFEDEDPPSLTTHSLSSHTHPLPHHPHPHPHPHSGLQPPPSSLSSLQSHHSQQQQQQHSPHDGANFLGLNNPSSSQSYPGLPTARLPSMAGELSPAGLSSPAMDGKRPDSLCSNSNDSGLSDVNCNFSAEAQAAAAAVGMDPSGGFRPKIWSLAHVATSENSPSPYLTSVSAAGSASGPRPVPAMAQRGPGLENGLGKPLSTSIPSGMQSTWGAGGGPGLYGGGGGGAPSPRSSSFGMGMNMNMNVSMNHMNKPSLAPPMFSAHPLSGMTSGLGPSSGGGYTQLSPFYPQSKLSVD